MKRSPILVLMTLSSWLLSGCGQSSADGELANDEPPQVVYLCKETNRVVKAPLQSVPAVHPETGRKSLYRALYCETCDRWYPVPPDDGRNSPLARLCPTHRVPLAQEGKIP